MLRDPDDLVPSFEVDDLRPWDRQPLESARAYHAFAAHFLRLPPWTRSLRRAYQDHQTVCKASPHPPKWASPDWARWKLVHQWNARVSAHDADVARLDRLRQIADVAAMQARHINLSVAAQNLAVAQLQAWLASGAVPKMSPLQLMRVIDLATAVERRSRGLPTEIVRHQNEATGPLLDLSRLDPTDLAVFEQLVQRCQPVDPQGGMDGHDD